MQPFSIQGEFQIAAVERFLRRFTAFRTPITAVPELHRAAAVLTFGNRALEVSVVQRMIFDFHRQALVLWIEGRTSSHRPGLEHPVELQAKVIVQLARRVLLYDEPQARRGRHLSLTRGLFGLGKVALGAIDREWRLRQSQVPCRSIMRR